MIAENRQPPRRTLARLGLRAALTLGVLVTLTLSANNASAQTAADRATAQALFDRAKKLMSAGNYAEACPALEESQRIEPRSGTLLNLADCHEQAGRLASAWTTFVEAATLAKTEGKADRESGARERAAALLPRLSHLVIDVPSAASTLGLEVTRDGQRVGPAQFGLPLPADAGIHVVSAKAPGRKPWQAEATVRGSASTTNVIVPDLESSSPPAAIGPSSTPVEPPAPEPAATAPAASPAVPPPAPTTSTPAKDDPAPDRIPSEVIIGGVVTGVLAVGSVVTGVLYSAKLDDFNGANERLAPNRSELRSQTQTLGVVNLVFFGGTVATAGMTIYAWTRSPSEQTPARAEVELRAAVGPGMTGFKLVGSL